jgi:hypothetical protein
MGLFDRFVKISGNFRTTKTTNRKTGKTSTSVKRVKPSGVARTTATRKRKK